MPKFDDMNETDVRELIVRPLLTRYARRTRVRPRDVVSGAQPRKGGGTIGSG